MRTKVRCGPRPRRSAVVRPPGVLSEFEVLPKSTAEFWKFCGIEFKMSMASVWPDSLISFSVTT